MTENQIRQITEMRERGEPYSGIAKTLNLSQNTVKSYCQRHGIGTSPKPTYQVGDITHCEQCGKEIVQNSLKRRMRFCSDKCRNTWWNNHQDQITRRAVYQHTCKHCGKPFSAYGSARRKYCSHECYTADRFGGGSDE